MSFETSKTSPRRNVYIGFLYQCKNKSSNGIFLVLYAFHVINRLSILYLTLRDKNKKSGSYCKCMKISPKNM